MQAKSFVIVGAALLLSLASTVIGDPLSCNAHLDLTSDEEQVSFDKMALEVFSTTGSLLESSQCTPDGNCFAVVYNLDQFVLKMRGPQGAVFEPSEYPIKKGQSCDNLSFKLKGFSLKFAVKTQTQEGKEVSGSSGINIELRRASKKDGKALNKQVTDAQGQVVFTDITIPDTYIIRVISSDDFTFRKEEISCDFKWETGFICESNSFLITGFSISGRVLSYNDPVPNVSIFLHNNEAHITDKAKNSLRQTTTNSNGDYKFSNVAIGDY